MYANLSVHVADEPEPLAVWRINHTPDHTTELYLDANDDGGRDPVPAGVRTLPIGTPFVVRANF
jgi:hypothetical protein